MLGVNFRLKKFTVSHTLNIQIDHKENSIPRERENNNKKNHAIKHLSNCFIAQACPHLLEKFGIVSVFVILAVPQPFLVWTF